MVKQVLIDVDAVMRYHKKKEYKGNKHYEKGYFDGYNDSWKDARIAEKQATIEPSGDWEETGFCPVKECEWYSEKSCNGCDGEDNRGDPASASCETFINIGKLISQAEEKAKVAERERIILAVGKLHCMSGYVSMEDVIKAVKLDNDRRIVK